MRQLDALRRPRRPGGVDQRQRVVAADPAPRGLEVEPRCVGLLQLGKRHRAVDARLDADDVLDARLAARRLQHRHELLLADHDGVLRVGEQVGDLLGRGGVVDRERCRAEVQRRGVAEMKLGTIHHHRRDGVPPADAKRRQAGRDPLHALGVLAPRDRLRVAGRAQGDLVGAGGDGVLKRLAQAGHGKRVGGGRARKLGGHARSISSRPSRAGSSGPTRRKAAAGRPNRARFSYAGSWPGSSAAPPPLPTVPSGPAGAGILNLPGTLAPLTPLTVSVE